MSPYRFVTLDVFTDTRFGGNPLAVFPDAEGLSDGQMQALAREFNLSETTFVLPPQDPPNTARVRIFNPAAEMPFAGHPTVGTGWVLAQAGKARDGMLRLEVPAGIVEVSIEGDGAIIAAPQPLTTGPELEVDLVARSLGLAAGDLVTNNHPPLLASTGNPFVFIEVTLDALARATPDLGLFRQVQAAYPQLGTDYDTHLYARDGAQIRTRMFAPLCGVVEDPATGSANVTLAALLLSFTTDDAAAFDIVQGVEMGRPSRLKATARRTEAGIFATVGGSCVPVFRGEVDL